MPYVDTGISCETWAGFPALDAGSPWARLIYRMGNCNKVGISHLRRFQRVGEGIVDTRFAILRGVDGVLWDTHGDNNGIVKRQRSGGKTSHGCQYKL